MGVFSIDINVDVGEGVGNESQLLPYVSSCNIACGGHAGDIKTMREVVLLAKQYQVKIGAHPSFPDKTNFGRVPMEMSCAALFASLQHQIRDLLNVLNEENLGLHHVKPHGALYNLAAADEKTAMVIIEVMKSFAMAFKLYVPYNSMIAKLAIENNIPIIYEAFADRNYNDDLSLVSRNQANALIHEVNNMFEHVQRIVNVRHVKTINGHLVPIEAETFCVHGDNKKALELIIGLREHLKKAGIRVQ